jgi:hypothetical protein
VLVFHRLTLPAGSVTGRSRRFFKRERFCEGETWHYAPYFRSNSEGVTHVLGLVREFKKFLRSLPLSPSFRKVTPP